MQRLRQLVCSLVVCLFVVLPTGEAIDTVAHLGDEPGPRLIRAACGVYIILLAGLLSAFWFRLMEIENDQG